MKVFKSYRLYILMALTVVLAGVGLMSFNVLSDEKNSLELSGTVEATTSTLSFRVGGNVKTLFSDEGYTVSAGDVMAELDKSDLILELKTAQAEESLAGASLRELEAGSREEDIAAASADVSQARAALAELEGGFRVQQIEEAHARLVQARAGLRSSEATLEMAKSDEKRFNDLYKSGSIGKREYESYRTSYLNAREGVKEARAAVSAASQQLSLYREGSRKENVQQAYAKMRRAVAIYDLVLSGARPEVIDQARARFDMAKSKTAIASLRLQYADLKAPFDGVVLVKAIEEGENVAPGTPAFSLADMTHPWIRCYIEEPDLPHVKLGQKVQVILDGLDRQFDGTVSFISSRAEFTPKTVETKSERVNLLYRVKVMVHNEEGIFKIGMPVTVRIDNRR